MPWIAFEGAGIVKGNAVGLPYSLWAMIFRTYWLGKSAGNDTFANPMRL